MNKKLSPSQRAAIAKMVASEEFSFLLEWAERKRGIYAPSYPESKEAHIQTERNGGMKGWGKLKYLLNNAPTIMERESSTNNDTRDDEVNYTE